MKKESSAGAVVFRKGKETRYLLLHYEEGHWDFPKGNIEEGEPDEDTIRREIKEETGIDDIAIIREFREKIHYFYKLNNELVSKEVVFHLAETKKDKIKLSFEHMDFKWLSFEEAMEKLTFKNAKNILKKADGFLRENVKFG